jgi:aerobic-type carbon monoxide dehydrogenase small subunit (CoxS/CutS family)
MTTGTRQITVTVNGVLHVREVNPRTLLSDFLRHDLGLTGTHVGCEHGVCGACTVAVDGAAIRTCLMFAVQVDGSEITTVEGLLDADGGLHPFMESMRREHGLQCGFCTPGIVMSVVTEVMAGTPLDEVGDQVLSGHLCRCTGYVNIKAAIAATDGASWR